MTASGPTLQAEEKFLRILRCLRDLGEDGCLPSRKLADKCGRDYNPSWFGDLATLVKVNAITRSNRGYYIAESGVGVLTGNIQLSELMREIRTREITRSGLGLEKNFDDWCARLGSGYVVRAKKGWPDRLLLDSEGKPIFVEIKKSGRVDDVDQRRTLGYLAQISAMTGNAFGVKVATFNGETGTWELRDVSLPTE